MWSLIAFRYFLFASTFLVWMFVLTDEKNLKKCRIVWRNYSLITSTWLNGSMPRSLSQPRFPDPARFSSAVTDLATLCTKRENFGHKTITDSGKKIDPPFNPRRVFKSRGKRRTSLSALDFHSHETSQVKLLQCFNDTIVRFLYSLWSEKHA